MSHDKNRILDKLKKFFALSASNNPHEAARALERAQKLIQAQGISQEDIALSDRLKLSCSCLVLFVLWPLALVMFEERLGTLIKWGFYEST